ncbi:hypothetical protein ACEQPO_00870 [Bacillus sp. SL00103]
MTGNEYNSALSTIQGQLQQSGQDPTSKEGAKAVKKQTIDALVGQSSSCKMLRRRASKPLTKR